MSQTHFTIPPSVPGQTVELDDEIDPLIQSFINGPPSNELYWTVFYESMYEQNMYHVLVEFFNPFENVWMILLNPRVKVHFLLPNQIPQIYWGATRPLAGNLIRFMTEQRYMPSTNTEWAVRRIWHVSSFQQVLNVIASSLEKIQKVYHVAITKHQQEFEKVENLGLDVRTIYKAVYDISKLKFNEQDAAKLESYFQKLNQLYEHPKLGITELKTLRSAATNLRETMDCWLSSINSLLKTKVVGADKVGMSIIIPWPEWIQVQFMMDLHKGGFDAYKREGLVGSVAKELLKARKEHISIPFGLCIHEKAHIYLNLG